MGNCFSFLFPPPPQAPPEEDDPRHRRLGGDDGPAMDPRLVCLLDFFRQLYSRGEELFREVIPFHGDEIMGVFNNAKAEERIGQLRMKRCHSAGAVMVAARGVDLGASRADLKPPQRFKVKTLDVGEPPPPPGGQGGGGTKAGVGAK